MAVKSLVAFFEAPNMSFLKRRTDSRLVQKGRYCLFVCMQKVLRFLEWNLPLELCKPSVAWRSPPITISGKVF